MDFTDVVVTVSGTRVRLRVWDTAGQERFFTFTKQFFRGTQGIILMYDITSMASYQTLMKWLQTIHQMGMESVVTVMVGNKVDLEGKREVPLQTASKLASRKGFEYIETSAVSGKNVHTSFYKLAESLIFSRGIFLPGEEVEARMQGGLTSSRAENGTFKVEDRSKEERRRAAISNRKLRHDSERERSKGSSGGCCS
ncbi:Ras-related protein Rab-15 [Geodia barretti]|nr:Ras-related protein Rab-15 [Geodia barretti]